MSRGNYTLKRSYNVGDILFASDFTAEHVNHIDNLNPTASGAYSDSPSQYRLSTDPGDVGTESYASSLAGEIERIRFTLNEIKTKVAGSAVAQWYSKNWSLVVPDFTVTTAKLAKGATFSQYLSNTTTNQTINNTQLTIATQAITLNRGKVRIKGEHSGVLTGDIGTLILRLNRNGATQRTRNFAAGITPTPKFATGEYLGDGSSGRHIAVGFKPKFLWLIGTRHDSVTDTGFYVATDDIPTLLIPMEGDVNGHLYENSSQLSGTNGFDSTGFFTANSGSSSNRPGNTNTYSYRWFVWGDPAASVSTFAGSIEHVDQPGVGTYTYTLTAQLSGLVTADVFNEQRISLEEIV